MHEETNLRSIILLQRSQKISEKDIRIVKRLGAGAPSVVFKGFLFKENRFVAVKKINVFEKVSPHAS